MEKTLYLCYFGLREPLVQTQVLPYLRELLKDGIEVSLLTFEPDFKTKWTSEQIAAERARLAEEGIDWHCLGYHKWPSVPATVFDIFRGTLFVRRFISRQKPDILHGRVHLPTLMAAMARKLSRHKPNLLFDIRGFFPEEYTDAGVWPAGGSLGAAYMAHVNLGYELKPKAMEHAYYGIGYTDDEIETALDIVKVKYTKLSRKNLVEKVADLLANQKIVGWFQGRSEWGPRALGARSILGDPRDREMLYKVNAAVKYRDGWRPFAPSILEEAADEYLEGAVYAPFMIMTFPVREEKKAEIPAVVHVDGTTHPQMVRRSVNPLYYDTIKRFGEKTGVPIVMNTSFNLKGEPVVNSPRDAVRTFYSSGLDALAIGNFLIEK